MGWVLKTDCSEKLEIVKPGYDVSIRVVDENNNPVEGADVTMHSEPIYTKTDKDGIAKFDDVEGGDHKLFIEYEGYKGEQSINLSGDIDEVKLSIIVEQKNALLDKRVIFLGSVLTMIIVILSITVWKLSRRKLST